MRTDKEKYEISKNTGHVADTKKEHVYYYNLWHCKSCESILSRLCECGKLFDRVEDLEGHSLEEYFDCIDKDRRLFKVCPNCKVILGWYNGEKEML